MATLFHYKCTECVFEIMSTPWGGDVYRNGSGYHLYLCEECKHLTKIEHGFIYRARKELERQKDNVLIRINHLNSPNVSFDFVSEISNNNTTIDECSHCGSPKLFRWEPEKDRCPKCNGILFKDNDCEINTD